MADKVIDLTLLQDRPRLPDSRWTVWEKCKKSRIQTDPSLVFKSQRIVSNDQYIISDINKLTRIPPQSVITKLRAQLLGLPNHVLVWDGYGVFDWDALNGISNIHQRKIIAEDVQEEFSWIRKQNVSQYNEISKFMHRAWHDSVSNKDRESLLCRRLLTDGLVKEMLDICNDVCLEKGENNQFSLLNNTTDLNITRKTEYVHFIINVSRNSMCTYVTPTNENGSHWAYLCIDLKANTGMYSDSLGWNIPHDLRQHLSKFFAEAKKMRIHMLHQPNNSAARHTCSRDCSLFAPLQTCSSVCGVAALSLCVLSFDKPVWRTVMNMNVEYKNSDKRLLDLISQPTKYSDELRLTIMSCLENREIRLDVLKDCARSINLQSSEPTFKSTEASTSKKRTSYELQDLIKKALKRKRMQSKPVRQGKVTKKVSASQDCAQIQTDEYIEPSKMSIGFTEKEKQTKTHCTKQVTEAGIDLHTEKENYSRTHCTEQETKGGADLHTEKENYSRTHCTEQDTEGGVDLHTEKDNYSRTHCTEQDTEGGADLHTEKENYSRTHCTEQDTEGGTDLHIEENYSRTHCTEQVTEVGVYSYKINVLKEKEKNMNIYSKENPVDHAKDKKIYMREQQLKCHRDYMKQSKKRPSNKEEILLASTSASERKLVETYLRKHKIKKKIKNKILSQKSIKSLFENMKEQPKIKLQTSNQEQEVLDPKSCSQFVYTQGLTLKGLSRVFYKNVGRSIGKNEKRDSDRKNSPLIEENGRIVGLKRHNKAQLSTRNISSARYIDKNLVEKIRTYLYMNGPIVKTQTVCELYQSFKQSTSRLMSSEFVEKLGKYIDITQIYVKGTAFILCGKYEHLLPVIQQLEELSKSQEKENFKSAIENKIKSSYIDALNSLQSPFDRQIMKGLMATITNPEFMTKLEGKKNKTGYRNSKDTYESNVNAYRDIEQTSLVARNDMTNLEQRALTKRIIARRKAKELKTVFKGRGRLLKSEEYPELAAVLELCFNDLDLMSGGGGLESHPRLTDGVLYRSCGNNVTMKKAREILLTIAPEDFKISLSTCFNYTENYRANSHQALQHHAEQNVNAQISLCAPPRTGVQQFVVNLHWSTANVNLILDEAHENRENTFVDSKDAKSIVCANIAPVQKPGKSWTRREYLDHDWDQSRTFAVTPMTHLILQTEKLTEMKSETMVMKTKRTGSAVTLLNISFFESESAFRSLNEIFLMIIDPKTSEYFRNPVTGKFKKDFVFVVDNGPSSAPGNILVKMCLMRIFHVLNLNSLCQVSYAEYHSKRNPVERVHAEENKALSRHGPFEIDTHLIKPGSQKHREVMETMLQEVSQCIQTGQFNGESIITLRGATENANVFNDENELKAYLSLNEDVRETFDGSYSVSNNSTTKLLDIIWKIDTKFTRKYADDFNEINEKGKMNKYTFRILQETTNYSLQPIPDYMKYAKTKELHYCDYDSTKKLFNLTDNSFVKTETDFFLPSQVLNLAYLVFHDPPNNIKTLLSLLAWVTPEEYDTFIKQRDDEATKTAEKDRDYINWKSHDLYKLKKKDLVLLCKSQSRNTEGTKIDLIKRLSEAEDVQTDTHYTGNTDSIPNTISGISSLSIAYIRLILFHHGVKTSGTKEELVLRVYLLKHQPDMLFSKEKQGLLDLIKVCEHFIQIQQQQAIMSLDSERMFPSNNQKTTRKIVKNCSIPKAKVELPCHVQPSDIRDLFQPLANYIRNDLRKTTKAKSLTSFTYMKTPGNTIKVKWLKSEVTGSGWHPGWYSATIKYYNEETDELTVEYEREMGYEYQMNFTTMVSSGMIEPSKPLLSLIETAEKILTIGQILEIKWSKAELEGTNWSAGWYEAVVIGINIEEDTATVRYKDEPLCTYEIEVTPAINTNTVRIKK